MVCLRGVSFGPLVFLIFENDLPLWIRNSMIPMFADDTKISRKITDVQDSFLLQEALDCLLEWSKYSTGIWTSILRSAR